MNGCVTILTTNNCYYLSETYSFDEIVSRISTASRCIDVWVTFIDQKGEYICIRSSSVEAIKITYDRPL